MKKKDKKILLIIGIIILIYGLDIVEKGESPSVEISPQSAGAILVGIPLIGKLFVGLGTFFMGLAAFKYGKLIIIAALLYFIITILNMFKK